jgi:hypothetical protein
MKESVDNLRASANKKITV